LACSAALATKIWAQRTSAIEPSVGRSRIDSIRFGPVQTGSGRLVARVFDAKAAEDAFDPFDDAWRSPGGVTTNALITRLVLAGPR
jgi:hypothetical protein